MFRKRIIIKNLMFSLSGLNLIFFDVNVTLTKLPFFSKDYLIKILTISRNIFKSGFCLFSTNLIVA
jgi:hypothetical protein